MVEQRNIWKEELIVTSGIYLGIDPGKLGAIAIIRPEHINIEPIPLISENIDAMSLIRFIPFPFYDVDVVACIENVWKPVTLARFAGILEGIFLALDIEINRVAPSTWRKAVLGNRLATKQDAVLFCLNTYPEVNLFRTEKSRVPDHNFAEALAIAHYARMKYGQTGE